MSEIGETSRPLYKIDFTDKNILASFQLKKPSGGETAPKDTSDNRDIEI